MKIAALFIIAENWNQHRCSSVGEVINTGYIHIMEQDSAMKRNRVLVYTTWIIFKALCWMNKASLKGYIWYDSTIWHCQKDQGIVTDQSLGIRKGGWYDYKVKAPGSSLGCRTPGYDSWYLNVNTC